MSSIQNKYDKIVNITRESFLSGSTVKKAFVSHLIGVKCHIQPYESQIGEYMPGAFGKDMLMFCDVLDIKEGDHVILGEKTYTVAGVETFDFSGNPHMEILIQAFLN